MSKPWSSTHLGLTLDTRQLSDVRGEEVQVVSVLVMPIYETECFDTSAIPWPCHEEGETKAEYSNIWVNMASQSKVLVIEQNLFFYILCILLFKPEI